MTLLISSQYHGEIEVEVNSIGEPICVEETATTYPGLESNDPEAVLTESDRERVEEAWGLEMYGEGE